MMSALSAAAHITLDRLQRGQSGTLVGVEQTAYGADSGLQNTVRRLIEYGFVAGERIEVLAVAFPGSDPLAVRVGSSRFALRRIEASLIWVAPDGV